LSIQLLDRLGRTVEADGGATVLGRFMVRQTAGIALEMNTFPTDECAYLVPESGGRWRLRHATENVEGRFPRAQLPDELDESSIRSVGRLVGDSVAGNATWGDVIAVSPLVPELSTRAELSPFEHQIKASLGHLARICRQPRTHLRTEVERVPVGRAHRIPSHAPAYLAAHTEDWERRTLRNVIAKRILADVRDEQYDIYENRVVVRLVDHLTMYLRRRVAEVSRLLRIFDEASGFQGSAATGSHFRQQRIYTLWADTLNPSDARRRASHTLSRLTHLLLTVSAQKDSTLYREIPRRALVGTKLKLTNILRDDAHYRRIGELWLDASRYGLQNVTSPQTYFEEMQDFCRSFDHFALLLTLRALHQVGFVAAEPNRPLSSGQAVLHRFDRMAEVTWSSCDGTITLRGEGIGVLRIVPLCSTLVALEDIQLRALIADAEAKAPSGTTTLILYLASADSKRFASLAEDLSQRLQSLAHEGGSVGQKRISLLPVSPWDIGSVERVARQLRWTSTAQPFCAYPPSIPLAELPELMQPRQWLEVAGSAIRILRSPIDDERIDMDKLIAGTVDEHRRLQAEDAKLTPKLRRDKQGREHGLRNLQRTLAERIKAAETRLNALTVFKEALTSAVDSVDALLACPTCGKRADPQWEFKPLGEHFSCTCSDCSTTWATISCGTCAEKIPVLKLKGTQWAQHAGGHGWIDRVLGADVLAAPWVAGTSIGFVCPHCGNPQKTDTFSREHAQVPSSPQTAPSGK
jgi:hypothetical protein